MPRREFRGGAVPLTLAADLTANATTFNVVGDPTSWPTGATAPFYVELDREENGLAEKVLVTTRTGNTMLGVTRGVDDTTAVAHTAGATIEHVLDSDSIDEANAHVNDDTRHDHSQYLRVGDHDITPRHLLGTSVPTGVPGTSAPGDSAAEGTSTGAARADHRHGRTDAYGLVGDVAASAVGDTAAAGTSSRLARADHKHAREAFGTPGASAPGDSAAAGTASTPARSDHRHARETTLGMLVTDAGDNADVTATPGSTTTLATFNLVVVRNSLVLFSGDFCARSVDETLANGKAFAGFLQILINGGGFPGARTKRYHSFNYGGNQYPERTFMARLDPGTYDIDLNGTVDVTTANNVIFSNRNLIATVIGGA